MPSDGEIVALYQEWSEELYCAGFMSIGSIPSHMVEQFRVWLRTRGTRGEGWNRINATQYELEMLDEYHRQERN